MKVNHTFNREERGYARAIIIKLDVEALPDEEKEKLDSAVQKTSNLFSISDTYFSKMIYHFPKFLRWLQEVGTSGVTDKKVEQMLESFDNNILSVWGELDSTTMSYLAMDVAKNIMSKRVMPLRVAVIPDPNDPMFQPRGSRNAKLYCRDGAWFLDVSVKRGSGKNTHVEIPVAFPRENYVRRLLEYGGLYGGYIVVEGATYFLHLTLKGERLWHPSRMPVFIGIDLNYYAHVASLFNPETNKWEWNYFHDLSKLRDLLEDFERRSKKHQSIAYKARDRAIELMMKDRTRAEALIEEINQLDDIVRVNLPKNGKMYKRILKKALAQVIFRLEELENVQKILTEEEFKLLKKYYIHFVKSKQLQFQKKLAIRQEWGRFFSILQEKAKEYWNNGYNVIFVIEDPRTLAKLRSKYGKFDDPMYNRWINSEWTYGYFRDLLWSREFHIIVVNPAGTTRYCHRCGGEVKIYGKRGRAIICPRCGLKDFNRDLNAARNVAIRGMKFFVGKGKSSGKSIADRWIVKDEVKKTLVSVVKKMKPPIKEDAKNTFEGMRIKLNDTKLRTEEKLAKIIGWADGKFIIESGSPSNTKPL